MMYVHLYMARGLRIDVYITWFTYRCIHHMIYVHMYTSHDIRTHVYITCLPVQHYLSDASVFCAFFYDGATKGSIRGSVVVIHFTVSTVSTVSAVSF